MIPAKCSSTTNNSNVKISDPKSKSAVFANPNRDDFDLVRYDGCVVVGLVGCDWIVIKREVGLVAVELKGCDVDHAAEQILATLEFVKANNIGPAKRAGLIVCTRYPKVDTKVQRLKQKLAKAFRAPLHVKTHAQALVLEDLLKFA